MIYGYVIEWKRYHLRVWHLLHPHLNRNHFGSRVMRARELGKVIACLPHAGIRGDQCASPLRSKINICCDTVIVSISSVHTLLSGLSATQ